MCANNKCDWVVDNHLEYITSERKPCKKFRIMLILIVFFKGFYNGYSPAERRRKSVACAALRSGNNDRVTPSKCDLCGTTFRDLERHSEDYSEPYRPDQYFLCRTCHRLRLHGRFRHQSSWQEFKVRVKSNWPTHSSPWYEQLNCNPDTCWLFDARPRALQDQTRAWRTVRQSCTGLQTDLLRLLAYECALDWSVSQLGKALRYSKLSEISRQLVDVCWSAATAIGYDGPKLSNARMGGLLILMRPSISPSTQGWSLKPGTKWRLHKSASEALRTLVSSSELK